MKWVLSVRRGLKANKVLLGRRACPVFRVLQAPWVPKDRKALRVQMARWGHRACLGLMVRKVSKVRWAQPDQQDRLGHKVRPA